MSEAMILDAIRTPRGRGKRDGSLHEVKPVTLLSGVLQSLQSRSAKPAAAPATPAPAAAKPPAKP